MNTHTHTYRVKERHLQLLNVAHALALLPCSVDGGLNDPQRCIWTAPPLIGHGHLLFIEFSRLVHTNVDSYIIVIAH